VKELPVGKTIRKDKKKRKRRENHKNIRVWCSIIEGDESYYIYNAGSMKGYRYTAVTHLPGVKSKNVTLYNIHVCFRSKKSIALTE
jgi:hypothetical protein